MNNRNPVDRGTQADDLSPARGAARRTGPQRSASGIPPAGNFSGHVYKFTNDALAQTASVEAWVAELRRLALVVCITARENYILEAIEKSGTTGPAKHAKAGIEFTSSVVPWAT
jgi:hypothetical protein